MFAKRQSNINSESDSDNESKDLSIMKGKSEGGFDNSGGSNLEIPLSVKAVIRKIEQAQLLRAKEDILTQLIEIMNKVELIMMRYTIDSSSPGRKGSLTENQRKKRKVFLEKIAEYVRAIDMRERTLIQLLSWLEEWNFILSEVAEVDIEEYYHWVAELEMMPETLKTIDGNVNTLCQITTSLVEEKKRQKKKLLIRGTLWKAWKDRVVKRPATAHALRPDQMISDQFALNTKVSEIQDMLQELISTGMFSKLENNAIKYISATMLNLSKALSTVNKELKLLNFQVTGKVVGEEEEEEEEEEEAQKEIPRKAFQELCEENEMLHLKLKQSEEKSEQLIRIKNFLGRQILFPSASWRTLAAKIPTGKDLKQGEIDSLLNKELENIIDESQKKGIRVPAIKWDSTTAYVAQGEAAADVAKLQAEDQVDHGQRKLYLPASAPQSVETLAANLEEEKVILEIKTSEFSDLQALDEKSFLEGKLKGQGLQSGTGGMWERLKKVRSQYSLGKFPVSSEDKIEPTVRPKEKEAKTEVELPKIIQPEPPELYKTETKGKKPVPGKTEDMPGSTKLRGKLHPRTPKQTATSPKGRSNLESFQRAILAFLRERMNNVGKAFDQKSIQNEEDALERAEVEKLNTIKSKMEEYIQKVTETVTKALRTYKDARKKQFREIVMKQKLALTTPQLLPKQTFMSSKAEIINFVLSEMTDPVIRKLVQTLLDELEGERDGTTVEQRLQGPEASQLQETDKEKLKAGRDAEDGQWVKGSKWKELLKTESPAKELSKIFTQSAVVLTPRWMKVLKPVTSQMQLSHADPDAMEHPEERQPPSSRTLLGFAQPHPMPVPKLAQISSVSMPQAPSGPPSHEHVKKAQSAPLIVEQEQELESQLTVPGILEQTSTPRESPASQKPEQMQIPQTTAEQVQISGVTTTQRAVLPLQQIQAKDITLTSQEVLAQGISLTPEQAQALGITLTPEQGKAQRISLTLQQAQTLGITLTPEQTKAQKISLTPQQAQTLGITLTSWQAQDLGLTLTPEQTKAQRVSLTPQQAQVLGVSLTPQQVQAQRINLSPEQAQALGIALTPELTQAQGHMVVSQLVQAHQITITLEEAQALGLTLTPQQVKAQGISLTPQQGQALGMTLTPEQVNTQKVNLTTEQAKALGITLTPEQVKTQRVSLTTEQAQALGITLTPEQAQVLGIVPTLQQTEALGVTFTPEPGKEQRVSLTPEQDQVLRITPTPKQSPPPEISLSPKDAQVLGITLTPQQAQIKKICLTPQQAQAMGIILTPEQANTLTISLTPQQAQDLGITLTLEQARAQRISLTPEQAQALGITLSPEQAQALGIAEALGVTFTPEPGKEQRVSLTPEQDQALRITPTPKQSPPPEISFSPEEAQVLGITLTPQQAQIKKICLTPQQAQAMGIILTPEQANTLTISLTPQQAQDLGITLTLEQARAQRISLTPEQAQALGITLSPEQAQALGRAEALGVTFTPEPGKEQRVSLTPEQVQSLGITPATKQGLPQEISLSPEEAQVLGITLTPQQAQIKKIYLTPQQAQAMGIILTPEQANTLTISLTPQQVQDLGITLTLEQARAQRISLTPEQAQALGITLSPEQAQALGIAEALGVTFTPEPGKEQRVSLTPEQVQSLGITPATKQGLPQEISLSPEEAQVLGITLTPQQAQIKKIYLTPQQAQAMGIILTPEQANTLTISLTPQQVQDLGITLTLEQARAQRISLTPEQAQALGITLSPEQAQALGIAEALGVTFTPEPGKEQRVSLTPEQVQSLGITPATKQGLPQEISLSPEEAQVLGITLTPQQAQIKKIYLTPQQAQAMGIILTPEQANTLTISLTPQQVQDLGITLTLEQARAQRISLTPEQAQALGITLSPEQAQALGIAEALGVTFTPEPGKKQRVSLTPEQVQSLGITPATKQGLPQEISLSPEEAQVLGITLTPQQAQIKKIYLTPQQAQAMGIILTPEQANTLTISLTPQQVQALGITLSPEQARAQRISLTPEQAQALGITLSPEQAQALGITLSPEQAQALGIAPILQQAEALQVTLTPEQVQALEICSTPEQTHTLGISLSPQQARDLGITLTPRQAKVQKICLTPEQAQALGITFTPDQARERRNSLTPEQARALGFTLSPVQTRAQRISLTPEQAEALGITLSPEQAEALGISFTLSRLQKRGTLPPKKFRGLDAPLTHEQAATLRGRPTTEQIQSLKIPIIPESIWTPRPAMASKQTQTIEIPLSTQWPQLSGVPLPKRQDRALGTILTPGQTQAFEQVQALQPPRTPWQTPLLGRLGPGERQTLIFTITLDRAQNLGVIFTGEQTRAAAVTLTSEQVAALEDALTEELAWKWGGLIMPEKVQGAANITSPEQLQAPGVAEYRPALRIPLTSEKPATWVPSPDRPLQQLKDFPLSTPLQKFRQTPLPPRIGLGVNILPDSEKLEKPHISPTYRQILTDRGQVTPTQLLTPEVPPTRRQLPKPETPSTPGLPLAPWHLFKTGGTQPPLIPETPFLSRSLTPSPTARVLSTSGELPGLSVPGGSDISKDLLISRLSPYQPSAIHEQVPYTKGLIIAEQEESLPRITPVPLRLSTAEEFSIPGGPQRISPSSVPQKRSGAVSPPKPELARAHPSASLAPFPTEKIRIAKVPDISEETGVLQDSFDVKPLGMFPPYVTSSGIPGSKLPHIGEKVPSGLEKPTASLSTQLSQTSQTLPSARDQRPRLPAIDKPWILTPASDARKAKTMGSPLTAQLPEDRYFVDVEAQRKNLVILNEAAQTSGFPSEYHTIARNLIIELLHMNTVRLGYLCRKYVAYRLIQLARNNITKRLKAIQNTGKGYETRNLYIMLDRIDQYQKKVMRFWTDKQKQLEERRKQYLWSMMQLFSQIEKVFKLNLSQPVPLVSGFKQTPDFTKIQRPVLELLIEDNKKPNIFKTFGQQTQMESIWNADLSSSSYPIMEKTSLNTLWAQLGGYPDIPKLLQFDIQWTFRKALASLQSQSKKIPK